MVEANQPAPRRSRSLSVALLCSLALNLLFIGGFAAAAWHFQHRHMKRGDYGLLGFTRKLPADHQDAFRKQVLDARASVKTERENVRSAWLEANSTLTVEPFDKEKFKAAMAKLREVENQYKTRLNDAFADIAAAMTPEERKLLQTWREKRRPRLLKRSDQTPADSGSAKSE
jgi:uncharacterized membrane protein